MKIYSQNYENCLLWADDLPDPCYGTVTDGQQTIYLTEQATADNGPDGNVVYRAEAVGPDGRLYRVTWKTAEEWDEHVWGDDGQCLVDNCGSWCEDESNACDWANPDKIEEI